MKSKILIILAMILATSCTELDYKQDFDFEIKVLPYKKSADPNEIVEIRYEIKTIEGTYTGTKYLVRSFQSDGIGNLTNEDGETFLMNDLYELPNKIFRLYYQPLRESSHSIALTFVDSWGHEKLQNIEIKMNEIQEP